MMWAASVMPNLDILNKGTYSDFYNDSRAKFLIFKKSLKIKK